MNDEAGAMDNKTLMNLSAAVEATTHSVFSAVLKKDLPSSGRLLHFFGMKMPKERKIEGCTKGEKTRHYLGV